MKSPYAFFLLLISLPFMCQGQDDPYDEAEDFPINLKFALSVEWGSDYLTKAPAGESTGFTESGMGYGLFTEFDFYRKKNSAFQIGANLLVSSGQFENQFNLLNIPIGHKWHFKNPSWYYALGADFFFELPSEFGRVRRYSGIGMHTSLVAFEAYLPDSDVHFYIEPLVRILPLISFSNEEYKHRLLNFSLKFGIGF